MSRIPTRAREIRARLLAHPRWRWYALVVASMGMMLSVVNVSIVNIALPSIAADFGVDVPSVGWVVTGYLATQATLLAIAGRAGDLFGRRRVFIAGVTVLCAASVLCALAWDAPSLVIFRVAQGIGASVMAPTVFSFAAELFSPGERGVAFGFVGGVTSIAPVLALNIAGVLVEVFGWRSVFWFTPAMGVLTLAGAALVLPESAPSAARPRFDLPGAGLLAGSLFPLLVALSRGETWGWASPATVGCAATGVVCFAGFVARERRVADPMVDLSLFRLRSLRTANLANGLAGAAMFGILILLPFYFSTVLGYGAVGIGLAITPIALSLVIVAPVAGRYVVRVGAPRLASSGFILAAAGATWAALAAPSQRYALLLPGIALFGTGLAVATSPVTSTAVLDVPPEVLGVAGSLPNISRYVGGALGAATLGVVLHAAVPPGLQRTFGQAGPYWRELAAGGFRRAVLVGAAVLVAAAVAAARMPRLDRRRAAVAPPAQVAGGVGG